MDVVDLIQFKLDNPGAEEVLLRLALLLVRFQEDCVQHFHQVIYQVCEQILLNES